LIPAAEAGRILEKEPEYGEDERTDARVLEARARCIVPNLEAWFDRYVG